MSAPNKRTHYLSSLVQKCCVPYCNSVRIKNINDDKSGTRMYFFPHNKDLQAIWMDAIGRNDLITKSRSYLTRHISVCLFHFEENCFTEKRNLKKNSIPSKFEIPSSPIEIIQLPVPQAFVCPKIEITSNEDDIAPMPLTLNDWWPKAPKEKEKINTACAPKEKEKNKICAPKEKQKKQTASAPSILVQERTLLTRNKMQRNLEKLLIQQLRESRRKLRNANSKVQRLEDKVLHMKREKDSDFDVSDKELESVECEKNAKSKRDSSQMEEDSESDDFEIISEQEKSNSLHAYSSLENCKLIYKSHLFQILESLAKDEAYMDVTLTAEGRSIQAHKCILSAASPYFKELLKQNSCLHPNVNMPTDIKFKELGYIVSYIYRGEITICAEELTSLLKTAELLKISGLKSLDVSTSSKSPETQASKKTKDSLHSKTDSKSSDVEQIYSDNLPSQNLSSIKEIKEESEIGGCWSEVVNFTSGNSKNDSSVYESPSNQDKRESPPFECPHCREVKLPLEVLESHLSSKHPTKPSFVCINCARVFRRQRLFQAHLKSCLPP